VGLGIFRAAARDGEAQAAARAVQRHAADLFKVGGVEAKVEPAGVAFHNLELEPAWKMGDYSTSDVIHVSDLSG